MWGPGGFSFQVPCQAVGLSFTDNITLKYTVGRQDTRILTHTSTFPYKATGLDRDEERKDRALVDVGGCLVLSFLRFTFSTAHLLIQYRPVFSGCCLTDRKALAVAGV